ncbi:MAG: hypothetical protein JRE43_05770, partial [Deltaproteobacteria bacterium]|nr:hypothetical protein [Deltaproteobacteria bacterium]
LFSIHSSRRPKLCGRPRGDWLAVWLTACGLFAAATPAGAERFVAVAWNDSSQGRGAVQRLGTEPPWAFEGAALAVGANSSLRFAGARLYALSPVDATVTAIDLTTWSVDEIYALGAPNPPLDIAVVDSSLAYLTIRDSTQLLRLDLETGATQLVLDLAGFEHPAGLLTAGMMEIDAGRLLIQVARLDLATAGSAAASDPTGYLAVVDIASEQLVDVDPVQSGIQAIALQGTFPKYKMNLLRDERRLYLSASGAFFDQGGLEEVDVDALASLGLAIAEADGQTAADLGSFAMVGSDRGLLVSSTDLAPSSHLARFSLAGGVQPEELWVTVDYRAPTMVHDPQTHTVFVPDGGSTNAVWVFDADSGEQLNREPLALAGPASDIELLCDPEIECDCAVGYSCAAVPTSSVLGITLLSLALCTAGIFGTLYLVAARRPAD